MGEAAEGSVDLRHRDDGREEGFPFFSLFFLLLLRRRRWWRRSRSGVRRRTRGRRREAVVCQQRIDHTLRVVISQLQLQLGETRRCVHEPVQSCFVADFAQEDLDPVSGQAGCEVVGAGGVLVDRGEEGGGDEVVVGYGAEGVGF